MFGFSRKKDLFSASLRADEIKAEFSESSHRLKLEHMEFRKQYSEISSMCKDSMYSYSFLMAEAFSKKLLRQCCLYFERVKGQYSEMHAVSGSFEYMPFNFTQVLEELRGPIRDLLSLQGVSLYCLYMMRQKKSRKACKSLVAIAHDLNELIRCLVDFKKKAMSKSESEWSKGIQAFMSEACRLSGSLLKLSKKNANSPAELDAFKGSVSALPAKSA